MCTHRGGPVTGRAGRDIRAGDERVAGRPCVHADRRNRPAGRWPGRDERSAGLALGGTRLQGQCDRDPPSAQAGPSEPESLCPGQVRPSRGVRGGLLRAAGGDQGGAGASHLPPSGPRSAPRRSRSLSLVQAAVFPSVEAQETSHPPPPAAAWAQAASAPRGPTRETGGKEPHDALWAIEVRQGHLRSG